MGKLKNTDFLGDSLEKLKSFPEDPRARLGYQLHQVQSGQTPNNWKPVPGLGKGITNVKELREETPDGWFRLVYVANIGNKIYVLHAFQKKSNQIGKNDIGIIKRRYKEAKQKG